MFSFTYGFCTCAEAIWEYSRALTPKNWHLHPLPRERPWLHHACFEGEGRRGAPYELFVRSQYTLNVWNTIACIFPPVELKVGFFLKKSFLKVHLVSSPDYSFSRTDQRSQQYDSPGRRGPSAGSPVRPMTSWWGFCALTPTVSVLRHYSVTEGFIFSALPSFAFFLHPHSSHAPLNQPVT